MSILGGGASGLAVAFYCKRRGIPSVVYEAGQRTGGNTVTFKHHGFRFDSGSHRLHDKDPETTQDVMALLGEDLQPCNVGSHIHDRSGNVNFPLSPLNLLTRLGPLAMARAGLSLAGRRLRRRKADPSFADTAIRAYGKVIANRFLIGYCEKLWGRPAEMLSPSISGGRLNGLDLKTFLKESFRGAQDSLRHLDGTFYYPRLGCGMITERLAEACDTIRTQARVTRMFHDGKSVGAIEINGEQRLKVKDVVCTLPVSLVPKLLDPPVDPAILDLAAGLEFRSLVLVALFLNRERVNCSGTVYFPDKRLPFTRVHEPRNRSVHMAPPGKTSLCAEIPCSQRDPVWKKGDEELVAEVSTQLCSLGWIKASEVIGARVERLEHAYPVLGLGVEAKVERIQGALSSLKNLFMVGRNAGFSHASLHQLLRHGRETVEKELCARFG